MWKLQPDRILTASLTQAAETKAFVEAIAGIMFLTTPIVS